MLHRTLLIALLIAAPVARGSLRVDLNPDNDRKDGLTLDSENWRVPDGASASQKFGDVTVTLRASGRSGASLAGVMWKAGYDSGATMASDGVAVKSGTIELVLSGLTPGKHSLVTYHNTLDGSAAKVTVSVAGANSTVTSSRKAAADADAASAHLEFDAEANKDVVVTIAGDAGQLILNGFELDTSDPAKRAIKPSPAQNDEHASENPVLSWTFPTSAASHHLYLGTSAQSVASATPSSLEFKGDLTEAKYQTEGLNPFADYFWRIDEIAKDSKEITPGQVWRFRVRRLAFPGAEGYGRFARGGRGGRVIEVSNVQDSGPGSLRNAVEAEGPRTVVFRVGGTIHLKDKLVIRNPYITVAGQTAPGDGICIRGATFGNYGTRDTIIRYVRIRVGDADGKTYDGTGFASSDHCIIDHCSISWTIDEAVSSRGAKNITFQRNLIAEPLNMSVHGKYVGSGKGHSFAGSISGEIGSFHHNLLANAAGRNWSLAGGLTRGGKFAGYLDVRNNVVYNWQHRTNDGGVRMLNLVNNLYIPGPATRVFHLLIAEMELKIPGDLQQYYVAGNVMEGRPQYDADNWANGAVRDPQGDAKVMKLDKSFCEPFVTTHSAKEVYENVMADVGCNWPKYDAVDERTIKDVQRRGVTFKGKKTGIPGIIDSQEDVGGWPQLKGGEAPADSDHDGMPNAWEEQNKLDPNNASDGNTVAADGYTNLETYLNGIVQRNVQTGAGR